MGWGAPYAQRLALADPAPRLLPLSAQGHLPVGEGGGTNTSLTCHPCSKPLGPLDTQIPYSPLTSPLAWGGSGPREQHAASVWLCDRWSVPGPLLPNPPTGSSSGPEMSDPWGLSPLP